MIYDLTTSALKEGLGSRLQVERLTLPTSIIINTIAEMCPAWCAIHHNGKPDSTSKNHL